MKIKTTSVLLAFFLVSCGGGGGGSDDEISLEVLDLTPDPALHDGTSYITAQQSARWAFPFTPRGPDFGQFLSAFSWHDVNNDGFLDQISAPGGYEFDGVGSYTPFEIWLDDGMGNFTSGINLLNGSGAEAMHPRKMLKGDINGDGVTDFVVLDHGYDAAPFPGEPLRLILSDGSGAFSVETRTNVKGFLHGGALSDLDHDGDLDLLIAGFTTRIYFNDGKANFSEEAGRIPDQQSFINEIFDLDGDGYLDIARGAHEDEKQVTRLFWGSSSAIYTNSRSIDIPAVDGYGIIEDFDAVDIDGDGDRDLIVNRTGDNTGPGVYVGWSIQILINEGNRSFVDETSQRMDMANGSENPFGWMWLLDIDNDGDLDMAGENFFELLGWKNDGAGVFTRFISTP